MRVWLDDHRPRPDGFDLWVKTVEEAISLLELGVVELISLDYDLGTDPLTGYDVALWIERAAQAGTLPELEIRLHSASPAGRQRMQVVVDRAKQYWQRQTPPTSANS